MHILPAWSTLFSCAWLWAPLSLLLQEGWSGGPHRRVSAGGKGGAAPAAGSWLGLVLGRAPIPCSSRTPTILFILLLNARVPCSADGVSKGCGQMHLSERSFLPNLFKILQSIPASPPLSCLSLPTVLNAF